MEANIVSNKINHWIENVGVGSEVSVLRMCGSGMQIKSNKLRKRLFLFSFTSHFFF